MESRWAFLTKYKNLNEKSTLQINSLIKAILVMKKWIKNINNTGIWNHFSIKKFSSTHRNKFDNNLCHILTFFIYISIFFFLFEYWKEINNYKIVTKIKMWYTEKTLKYNKNKEYLIIIFPHVFLTYFLSP